MTLRMGIRESGILDQPMMKYPSEAVRSRTMATKASIPSCRHPALWKHLDHDCLRWRVYEYLSPCIQDTGVNIHH